jgi:hypothetical protein
MNAKPTFSGEVQFAGYSDSSRSGPRVTLRLDDRAELELFVGCEGKRYMAVLVEIMDDETPAQERKTEPLQQSDKPKGGARSQWVAMRCNEPAFQQWLCRAFPLDWRRLPSETASGVAANVVRKVCGIESRAELDANPAAAKYFDELIRAPYALHCGGVAA